MDEKLKVITIRLPDNLHKAIKKNVIDEEKTIGKYFMDLAIEDLKKKGIEIWQKE